MSASRRANDALPTPTRANAAGRSSGADNLCHAATELPPAQLPALLATVRALQTRGKDKPATTPPKRVPAGPTGPGAMASKATARTRSGKQGAARSASRSGRGIPARLALAMALILAAVLMAGYFAARDLFPGPGRTPTDARTVSTPGSPPVAAPTPIRRAAPGRP